jgi:hypothetical protein
MLALILAMLLVPAANTWTVDDDGPADFAQITAAIAAVPPGGTLLVEPGTYDGFDLTKRMTIVGRAGGARPHVTGLSNVSATTFTLAGLDFDMLTVTQVASRGRIDDCRFGYVNDPGTSYALSVSDCAEVVLSRLQVKGSKAYSQSHPSFGGSALQISTSNVTLVDCALEGAKGYDATDFGLGGGAGGQGLTVSGASRVTIVAPNIEGGPEGWGLGLFGCQDGPSGAGLAVIGSTVVLRGTPPYHKVVAGWVDGLCTNYEGPDISVTAGQVVIGGVWFDHGNVQVSGGGTLVEPPELEPFLTIGGTDAPGGHRDITLHGPAGASCLLAVSTSPAHATLGPFDDKLWVGLSGFYLLLPLVTQGREQPIVLSWTIPRSTAALVGLSIELQPFFPGLPSTLVPGKSVAGNVAELIVRF